MPTPTQLSGRLLRNCALEQLAGVAVEEREAEMSGTLAQAVKDADTVLGIVGGGSGILVHQAIPEGAIHQDRQLAGGGRDGFLIKLRRKLLWKGDVRSN